MSCSPEVGSSVAEAACRRWQPLAVLARHAWRAAAARRLDLLRRSPALSADAIGRVLVAR
jgi:hypothetical protein